MSNAAYLQSITVTDTKQALFASQRSAAFTANSLTQIVCGIYWNAGIDGATTSHSGRRTFLTNLAEKGVSTRVMMHLLVIATWPPRNGTSICVQAC